MQKEDETLSSSTKTSISTTTVKTATPVPDPVFCKYAWCSKIYRGRHRQGTRARHYRLKHGEIEKLYPCESPDCLHKPYRRQDARLKHYRAKHPGLLEAPSKSGTGC